MKREKPGHFPYSLSIGAMSDGRDAFVEIESLEMHASSVNRREIKEALAWAAANRDLLLRKFKEYNP